MTPPQIAARRQRCAGRPSAGPGRIAAARSARPDGDGRSHSGSALVTPAVSARLIAGSAGPRRRPPRRSRRLGSRGASDRAVARSRSAATRAKRFITARVPAGIRRPTMTFSFRPISVVDLAVDRRLGQHPRGLLERGRGDERAGLQAGLGDALQHRLAPPAPLPSSAINALLVDLVELLAVDLLADQEGGVARRR